MQLLLDTHTLIWYLNDSENLPRFSKNAITDLKNTCFISVASLWEISIKYSLDRLSIISSLEKLFEEIFESDFTMLSISNDHLLHVSKLPFHHKDPFDRLIIAQPHKENLTLISKDSKFKNYNIPILWDK